MKVKIVIADIEKCAPLLNDPERFCSPGRLEKCASIADPAVRLRGLAAELALSYALSGERLLPPEYRYEKSGKPVIDEGFISLSHSGGFAVCALSPVPVGVDIEEYREVMPSAAKRILTEAEYREYLGGGGTRYLIERFVMKEACLKLTGKGVFGGMDGVFERDGQVFFRGVRKGFSAWFSEGFAGCAVTGEPFGIETVHI